MICLKDGWKMRGWSSGGRVYSPKGGKYIKKFVKI